MAAKKSFTPQSLRGLLAFLLIVIAAGGGALFYLGLNEVQEFSSEVNRRTKDADASGRQIEQLQLLKGQLSESESLVNKADRLFASADTYQSQVLTDLKNYASRAGLSIGSTDFSDPAAAGTYTVEIKFSEPTISYSKLIQFLTLTEGNLPKIQTSSIELYHVQNGGDDSVEVASIVFNVAVR